LWQRINRNGRQGQKQPLLLRHPHRFPKVAPEQLIPLLLNQIPPAFKFVFTITVVYTLLSGVAVFSLAITELFTLKTVRHDAVEAFANTWKLGVAAIFGLICGRYLP